MQTNKSRLHLAVEIAFLEVMISIADAVEAFRIWVWDRPPVHVLALACSIATMNLLVLATLLMEGRDPGLPIACATSLWIVVGYHAWIRMGRSPAMQTR